MKRYEYDLVIVGAGSGGYAAARTARDLGARVALVDAGPLGGLCILRGCMPSKTLLATSDRAQEIRESSELGITTNAPRVDLPSVMRRKARIIGGFTEYRVDQLRSFPLHEGHARFLSPTELAVGDAVALDAPRFIVATGSVVRTPPFAGLEEVGYLDSDAALEIDHLPRSLIVLGGGYVASELGQFFARLGVETTFLIRGQRLLSGEDEDVGSSLTTCFRDEGIRIEDGVTLLRAERRPGGKAMIFEQDGETREIVAEEIFAALGRRPNIADLDLARAGVEAHPITGIRVGDDLRTSNPRIFAVGDVLGQHELVHVAIYQGEIAARNAVRGERERADSSLVTGAHTVFSDPQIAIVGATARELDARGERYLVAGYPFSEHGKAISIGKTKGFVKMLADPRDGRILGAAIIGAEASDLIHEVVVAMRYRATVQEFATIPHLHPTLAEILTYPAEELAEMVCSRTVAM